VVDLAERLLPGGLPHQRGEHVRLEEKPAGGDEDLTSDE
jgi:hypothetical protein